MAAKNSTLTFKQVMDSLKRGSYAPVYILMGDEPYDIDQISDFVINNALKPDERDFNLTVVFGGDTNAVAVADACKQFPMMAERQVVVVKEAQGIRNIDPILRYLQKPTKTTILVWCHKNGKIDGRSKMLSLASANGIVFESKKLRDYELPDFIKSYLGEKQIEIEGKASEMIAEHVGSDLCRITSELDKLIISLVGKSKMITSEIVEREIGVSKDFNVFEFRSAIVNRDILKANMITKYFDNNPKTGTLYSFLPMLFNFFQNLMVAYYSLRKQTVKDISTALNLKSEWAAKDYITGMRNYGAKKTLDIIGKIREIDAKSKGIENPNTSQSELMKELVFFILH